MWQNLSADVMHSIVFLWLPTNIQIKVHHVHNVVLYMCTDEHFGSAEHTQFSYPFYDYKWVIINSDPDNAQ